MKAPVAGRWSLLIAVLTCSWPVVGPGRLHAEDAAKEIVLREALVLPSGGRGGRTAIHRDAVEALLVAGKWTAPKAGDAVTLPDGTTRAWETATAGADGTLTHQALRGGYAFFAVRPDAERVMILHAAGHSLAYVNGEPRAGDPYATGSVRLPVALRKGSNDFLFLGARGSVKAVLRPAPKDLYFDSDATLPDLIVGEKTDTWGAVLVVNATTRTLDGLAVRGALAGGEVVSNVVPSLPPLSTRKVAFALRGPAPERPGDVVVTLELLRPGDTRPADAIRLTLNVRRADENHRRTFRSGIDGSVQFYAVNPARPVGKEAGPPALFLSLHGAGVDALSQAKAYSPKTWGHIVAPTNRRPYGFDWEDWGRLDALEVLQDAQKVLRTDPRRTYLTGHSMGGHGTWHLGATYPDRFAAIGPSAGWISFWTYGGGVRPENPSPVEEMLLRSAAASDLLLVVKNCNQHGVYILHGAADNNVPVAQARQMQKVLSAFHRDFIYHEQPGASHWWDASDEHGTDCVDWAPLFDFFARRVIPPRDAVRQVDFTTVNPGVSAWSHWVGIEAQVKPLKPSSVSLRYDPGLRRFSGTTENVSRLALDLGHVRPGAALTLVLDGQKLEVSWPEKARLWLRRDGDRWVQPRGAPPASLKGPHRAGPFKDVFRNRMLLVYGTRGTAAENAWALARARYDAETFWYRGNGSVDVIADAAFDPSADRDRNVILYGNADTNGAWPALLWDSPVQVRRGVVRVGDREEKGDDLACLFLRPRPGSDRAAVGVVAGSGLPGMRLTERQLYFVSGVGYPDCLVIGPEMLSKGAEGVRVAGFFGNDWGVASGEFVWRQRD